MRNRAKCKLCNIIIESFHSTDYVLCKCGEIAVDGGDAMRCYAHSFDHFLRVDDDGNEIVVIVKPTIENSTADIKTESSKSPIVKQDLLKELDELVNNIERLPQHAMMQPITHADFCSLLMLLSAILRA
jgi:hypothetical protein